MAPSLHSVLAAEAARGGVPVGLPRPACSPQCRDPERSRRGRFRNIGAGRYRSAVTDSSGDAGDEVLPGTRDSRFVVIVHGTKKFRDRLRAPLTDSDDSSTTSLGDRYATAVFWRP